MAGWKLDEKRFREEVFRAQDKGWDPKTNLFRVYQLALDERDPGLIDAALKGVRAFVNRSAISGAGPAKVLLAVHKDAAEILPDPARRESHRKAVQALRADLQRALRDEISGASAIPPAVATALATAREQLFTRDEVFEALAGVGCQVREPVALPPHGRVESKWREVAHELAFLNHASLRSYLEKQVGAAAGVSAAQLTAYRTKLQSTAGGDVFTAEMKIVSAVQQWLAGNKLVELLRAELVRGLAAEATMGEGRLVAGLKDPGLGRTLTELGLPDAGELAYALLCEARYPTEQAASWRTAYQDARANRDLRGAYDVLVAQQGLDRELIKERDELKAEIARVDAMLAEARLLEDSDVEAAAERYVEAAKACRDAEIDSALKRCRPERPQRVMATVIGESVEVSWTPSSARVGRIGYRIVRHVAGGASGDGGVVGLGLSGLTVTDAAAPAGMSVSYEVWTLRNDEPSAAGRRSAPVAVLRSVRNLQLTPGERWVEVSWELPEGATAARLTRRSDGEGPTTVRCEGTSHRDTGLRTGVNYEYRVESEYTRDGGEAGHGAAVVARVRPQKPPQQVRDLALAAEDDVIVLTWTAPPLGEVEIRMLDESPDLRPGQIVASTSGRLGARVRPIAGSSDRGLRIAVPTDGRRHWLLPLTVVDGFAVVGHFAEYDSRLPSISRLKAERLGAQIRLTWSWPARVSEALVLSRAENPPTGPDDPAAARKRITHALYQRSGCHVAATGGVQWLGVCVTAFSDGVPVHGPMTTVAATAPAEAHYEIHRVGGFRNRNRYRVQITAESAGVLRDVLVVARSRIPPLRPEDGHELARVPGPDRGGTSMSGEFSVTGARPLHLRVFPLGDQDDLVMVPVRPMQLLIT